MVRYIINARDDMSFVDMHGAVKKVSPTGGELLMTIAEKLKNEGKEEGIEIGEEKGIDLALTALEAFRAGKDLEEVMKLTGLERDKLLKIKKQALK